MTSQGLLVIGHGSPLPNGNRAFLALVERLAASASEPLVAPCFLSHAQPSIVQGVTHLVERGAEEITALPLMLLAAAHSKIDIPRQLDAAHQQYTHIRFFYGRPLGVHSILINIGANLIARAAKAAGRTSHDGELVLLVGRGSSDSEANAAFIRVARLLREKCGATDVAYAYCDVALPSVSQGLTRAVRLGVRRVILLPYLLFPGVLMDRLQTMLAQWQVAYPHVEFLFAGAEGIGADPLLLDICRERVTEARADGALIYDDNGQHQSVSL